jgi:RNA polymerase sigma factor (sigma-70 family)
LKKSNSQSEADLVVSLKGGSISAFGDLFEIYSQKLYRFTFSYLKSEKDSEDLVQEVFMKIWSNRSALKTDTSFQSYLFTIAFHAIQKGLVESLASENPILEEQLQYETLISKLNQLIDLFPPRRKEIFLKRKKEGKSIHAIALEMGISEKTVENQITEAMHSLRKSFSDDKIASKLFFLLFIA